MDVKFDRLSRSLPVLIGFTVCLLKHFKSSKMKQLKDKRTRVKAAISRGFLLVETRSFQIAYLSLEEFCWKINEISLLHPSALILFQ